MTRWWSRRTRSSPTAPDAVVVAQDAVDDAQDAPWLGSNDSDGSDDPWLADDTVAAQDRIDTVAAKDPWLDGRDASTTGLEGPMAGRTHGWVAAKDPWLDGREGPMAG